MHYDYKLIRKFQKMHSDSCANLLVDTLQKWQIRNGAHVNLSSVLNYYHVLAATANELWALWMGGTLDLEDAKMSD